MMEINKKRKRETGKNAERALSVDTYALASISSVVFPFVCELVDGAPAAPPSKSSGATPRIYKTLLQRINTSPKLPKKRPPIHSSVETSYCKRKSKTEAHKIKKKHRIPTIHDQQDEYENQR